MLKIIVIPIILLMIQGCSTFRIGDLQSYRLVASSTNEPNINLQSLPVVITHHATLGMDSDWEISATKKAIIEATKEKFNNNKVNFIENYDSLPNEYIKLMVVQDLAFDMREGDFGGARYTLAIISGISLMTIPAIDYDTENYIKIVHMKDGKEVQSHVYIQDSRRMFGAIFLFSSPFLTMNDTLQRSLSDSFQEFFSNES